ncbi:hypothetical protein Leryth_008529 [Lithospermum erythrorhizon]|nr:hypothetical protein Leryth_008529 [Lithospermum erythrorhizon]
MKDRWLKAAYRDTTMVADLLLRLKQPPPPPPPFQHLLLPPSSWGQKQPRSTPTRKYSTTTTSTRCSPTTPLSFSAATTTTTASPSDDGYDEASVSCPASDPLPNSRSKNLSRLKEEETELLKERVKLKRELESIHVNLKEQINMGDNLKRIKLDLNQQSTEAGVLSTEPEARFSNHRRQMEASTANVHQSVLPKHAIKEERALANSCRMQEVAEIKKGDFVLPDLNMPVGEDEIAAELW